MNPHSIGAFALLTIILALAAIGRLLGLSLHEALYIAGLTIAVIGYIGTRRRA